MERMFVWCHIEGSRKEFCTSPEHFRAVKSFAFLVAGRLTEEFNVLRTKVFLHFCWFWNLKTDDFFRAHNPDSLSEYVYPTQTRIKKDWHVSVHCGLGHNIHGSRSVYLPTGEWINRMWSHIMKYYLTIKNKKAWTTSILRQHGWIQICWAKEARCSRMF